MTKSISRATRISRYVGMTLRHRDARGSGREHTSPGCRVATAQAREADTQMVAYIAGVDDVPRVRSCSGRLAVRSAGMQMCYRAVMEFFLELCNLDTNQAASMFEACCVRLAPC